MDMRAMWAKAKSEMGKAKPPPPPQPQGPAPSCGPKIEAKALALRGCSMEEVAKWQQRGETPAEDAELPSQNAMNTGTTYALEVADDLYNQTWQGRIQASIQVCIDGGCEALVVLRNNRGFGTADYIGRLNKVPVLNTAVLVGWVPLQSTTAAAATGAVLAIIANS